MAASSLLETSPASIARLFKQIPLTDELRHTLKSQAGSEGAFREENTQCNRGRAAVSRTDDFPHLSIKKDSVRRSVKVRLRVSS